MRSSGCPEVRIMGRSGQRSFTSHDRSTPSMTPGSRMSAKIMATSDKSEVFNGICGAESGSVPVSAISPALLVSEIEVQRKDRSQDKPPYLGRPTEGLQQ